MRRFATKVELQSQQGAHVRWVPGTLASEMVRAGAAEIASMNGRVKTIRLVTAASTHAERTGPPTAMLPLNTRFTRWIHLEESGTRIIEHHPRSTYKPDLE